MNVETMSLDPRIAAIHYRDYRKKVREARANRIEEAKKLITDGNRMRRTAYSKLTTIEKEDITLMESYRAMAKGARILNVASVIRQAGLDKTKRLPVLAIARATWQECFLKFERSFLVFSAARWVESSWKTGQLTKPEKAIGFMSDILGSDLTNMNWRKANNYPEVDNQKAMVPLIPVHLRPEGDLAKYCILWEAKWEKAAPQDPLLLRHVHGHIYSVCAQWDLTDIERAVLEGRLG